MRKDCSRGEPVSAVCNRRPWATATRMVSSCGPVGTGALAGAALGAPQRGAGKQPRVGGAQRSLPWVKTRMDLCPEGAPECAARNHASAVPSGRVLLLTSDTQGSAARNPGLYSSAPLGHGDGLNPASVPAVCNRRPLPTYPRGRFELPPPTDGDCKSPARLRARATGTLLPSLSFHTHQTPTHRRTP